MGLNSPIPVSLEGECRKATKIVRSFVDSSNDGLDKVVPRSVLTNARGFAVFTVLKAGFLLSARAGSGVVIAKLDDGSWSAPSAIGLGGVGLGTQLGAEVTDFLIVLNSNAAVKTFMTAGSMTIGGNLSVAVGPMGRNAEGSGTVSSKGKTAALYSYSKTKGLFGGVSVEGSVIVERQDANRIAYGYDVSSADLLSGRVDRPDFSNDLVQMLGRCTGLPGGRTWVDDRFDSRDEDGNYGELDEEGGGRDSFDSNATPGGFGSPSRKERRDSGEGEEFGGNGGRTRSSSYGQSYAFGEQGVGGFSNHTSPRLDRETKQRPANRSRSGSLASMFKKDLMGNEATTPRMRSSPNEPPSLSRKSSGLKDIIGKVLPPIGSPKIAPVREGRGESDPFGEDNYSSARATYELDSEPNPFEEEKPSHVSARSRSSTLDPELDLSGEVLSPWNNNRGLPSPKPIVASTRPRASSSLSYSAPLDYEPRPEVRPRDSSNGFVDRRSESYNDGDRSSESTSIRSGSPKFGSFTRPKIGILGGRSRSSSLQSIIAVVKHGASPQTLGTSPAGLAPSRSGRSRAGSASTPTVRSPLRDVDGDEYDWSNGQNNLSSKFGAMQTASPKKLSKTSNGYSSRLRESDEDDYGSDGGHRGTTANHDDTDDEGDREYRKRLEQLETKFRENVPGYGTPSNIPPDGSDIEDPFASRPSLGNRTRSASAPKAPLSVRPELADAERDGLPRAIALHDFPATHDGDLGLRKGDIVIVTKGGTPREEWWTGKSSRTGSEGIFPANFVELTNVPAAFSARHNLKTAPAY